MAKLVLSLLLLAVVSGASAGGRGNNHGGGGGGPYCPRSQGYLSCPKADWWADICKYGNKKYGCEPVSISCASSGAAYVTVNNCFVKQLGRITVKYTAPDGSYKWAKSSDKCGYGSKAVEFAAKCGTKFVIYTHDGRYWSGDDGCTPFKSSGCPYDLPWARQRPACKTCGPYTFTVDCSEFKGDQCKLDSGYWTGKSGDHSCAADYGVYDTTCTCIPAYRKGKCAKSDAPCAKDAYCTGDSYICPAAGYYGPEKCCRQAYGKCDVPDFCNGTSGDCPDKVQPEGKVCRRSVHPCDYPETCDGTHKDCPSETMCNIKPTGY